jgi:WD40 repeat protein
MVDVRALGYIPPSVHEGGPFSAPAMQPICFVDDNDIIVAFTTRIAPKSVPRRGDTTHSPLWLRALFIDSQTGKVLKRQEWPTASDRARITSVQGTGFAVITPDLLTLYSTGLRKLKELSMNLSSDRRADIHSFSPQTSPSGRYLLIQYEFLNGVQEGYEWIDLQKLRTLKQWDYVDTMRRRTFSPSDGGTAIEESWDKGTGIAVPGSNPTYYPCGSGNPRCLSGVFVSGDRLFSSNPPNRIRRFSIRLTRSDGSVLFDQELGQGETVQPPYPVRGGGRFAIAIYNGHGGSHVLDIARHLTLKEIRIYDSESGRKVYALQPKSENIRSISAFALSGDGSLLALIDQNGTLRLYRVAAP